MKKIILSIIFILFIIVTFVGTNNVLAETLTIEETIENELNNLDLSKLEEFFNSIESAPTDLDFSTIFNGFINGNYSIDYENVLSFVVSMFTKNIKSHLPSILSIVFISIVCSLIVNFRGGSLSDEIKNIVLFAMLLAIILILSHSIITMFQKTKTTIENIAKFNEIMSPIMLSLMIASGGKVSAGIFSPTIVFLSTGFINIVQNVLIPLISFFTIFSILSNFSNKIKLNKFTDFFTSTFKWVLGLLITLSGVFITVQGINASVVDGVSIKAAKYAISNMVPIVGGFLKDGFDIVTAGSIIIKNVLGITGVVAIFYLILSPTLSLVSYSFLLKLVSAIIEPFSDVKLSNTCTAFSKAISHLIACMLVVGLMFFITILILMISSSAFV
ncbi:MAG: stage III sporulation protein AE [Clostridia bacterium]|nr:stage III sporulation protein AE [Clostridia bacterium]